jgi:hypothetical protein
MGTVTLVVLVVLLVPLAWIAAGKAIDSALRAGHRP